MLYCEIRRRRMKTVVRLLAAADGAQAESNEPRIFKGRYTSPQVQTR
jgi:hypothetical protein